VDVEQAGRAAVTPASTVAVASFRSRCLSGDRSAKAAKASVTALVRTSAASSRGLSPNDGTT
jgi:hypothetical protein